MKSYKQAAKLWKRSEIDDVCDLTLALVSTTSFLIVVLWYRPTSGMRT